MQNKFPISDTDLTALTQAFAEVMASEDEASAFLLTHLESSDVVQSQVASVNLYSDAVA